MRDRKALVRAGDSLLEELEQLTFDSHAGGGAKPTSGVPTPEPLRRSLESWCAEIVATTAWEPSPPTEMTVQAHERVFEGQRVLLGFPVEKEQPAPAPRRVRVRSRRHVSARPELTLKPPAITSEGKTGNRQGAHTYRSYSIETMRALHRRVQEVGVIVACDQFGVSCPTYYKYRNAGLLEGAA